MPSLADLSDRMTVLQRTEKTFLLLVLAFSEYVNMSTTSFQEKYALEKPLIDSGPFLKNAFYFIFSWMCYPIPHRKCQIQYELVTL